MLDKTYVRQSSPLTTILRRVVLQVHLTVECHKAVGDVDGTSICETYVRSWERYHHSVSMNGPAADISSHEGAQHSPNFCTRLVRRQEETVE